MDDSDAGSVRMAGKLFQKLAAALTDGTKIIRKFSKAKAESPGCDQIAMQASPNREARLKPNNFKTPVEAHDGQDPGDKAKANGVFILHSPGRCSSMIELIHEAACDHPVKSEKPTARLR